MCIKDVVAKVKPVGLLFFPNIKTLILIYVLSTALVLRNKVDSWVYSLIGEQLKRIHDLLECYVTVNLLTIALFLIIGFKTAYRISKGKSYSWLLIGSLFAIVYLFIDSYWDWAKTPLVISYKWLFIIISSAFVVAASTVLFKEIRNTPTVNTVARKGKGFSVTTRTEALQDTGWQKYAENLVGKLLNTDNTKESFALGVSGIWGSGKTTFLNVLENKLKGKVYLVKINPWNSESPTQISDDFFKTLISSLTFSSYQRQTITQYAKLLGQLNAFGDQTNLVTSILKDTLTPISDAKDKAETVIGRLPLPVVVLIDDLDRLDGSELMAVLRLVRVTANFKNLIFVVAYDKDYVSQTLAKAGLVKGDEYLKKIFSLEVCLPSFENFVLANHLYNELKEGLDDEGLMSELEFMVYRGIPSHRISYYLPTFRDVKRFVNQFCLDINSFIRAGQIGEIDVADFFILELLHYYDFAAYQRIQDEPLSLLDYGFNIDKKYAYSYHVIGCINGVKDIEAKDKKRKLILDGYKDGVPDLLWILFGRTATKGDNLLRFPTNFSKYFSFRINRDIISLQEFSQLLELDKEDISSEVREYCKGDISRIASLKHHLISFVPDSNNERQAFNVAYALLELAMYGGIDAAQAFKIMFDKSRYKDVGKLPAALSNAIKSQMGKDGSWYIIQDILNALVEFDIIDQTDEFGGYVEYVSVLNWNQLKCLAEENFTSALGGRKFAIQDITDRKTWYHEFLCRAVVKVSKANYDGEHDEITSQSLLLDKLGEIYASTNNRAGLKQFFDNLIPDIIEDVLDVDELISRCHKNIELVFGCTYKDKDFYTFLKKAFCGNLLQVNKRLSQMKMEEIDTDNECTKL